GRDAPHGAKGEKEKFKKRRAGGGGGAGRGGGGAGGGAGGARAGGGGGGGGAAVDRVEESAGAADGGGDLTQGRCGEPAATGVGGDRSGPQLLLGRGHQPRGQRHEVPAEQHDLGIDHIGQKGDRVPEVFAGLAQ